MRSVKAKKKEDEDKEGKKTGTENFWQVQNTKQFILAL